VLESRGWAFKSEFKHGPETPAWFEKDGRTMTGYNAIQLEWKNWRNNGGK
jgi:hypothetical protein